jgi:hypothetical protein
VHRNNVVAGLVDVLAANHPVVQQLVGEAFFRAMAAAFVRQSPPRSPVLAHYGDADAGAPAGGLAAFVESFTPAASLPYLADMVRLECARTRAFHAADALPLGAQDGDAALRCGDRIGELRLELHPALQLLQSRHAVVSLWAAHQAEGEPVLDAIDLDVPEAALVLRPGLQVLVLPLAAADGEAGLAALIGALRDGVGLAEAAAQALAADAGFDLGAGLSLLVRQGALCAIHLS